MNINKVEKKVGCFLGIWMAFLALLGITTSVLTIWLIILGIKALS